MIIHKKFRRFTSWTLYELNLDGRDLSEYLEPAEYVALDVVARVDESDVGEEIRSAFKALLRLIKRDFRKGKQTALVFSEPGELQRAEQRFIKALYNYDYDATTVNRIVIAIHKWGGCWEPETPRKVDMTMGTYFDKKNALGYDLSLYLTPVHSLALHNLTNAEYRVESALDKATWQATMRFAARSLFAPDSSQLERAEERCRKACDNLREKLEYEGLASEDAEVYVAAVRAWARCETPKIQPDEKEDEPEENDDVE